MNFILKSFLVGAVLCSGVVSTARAEIFFVEDQTDKFSVAFPDLWAVTSNQKKDDKLTVSAPGDNALASCRVRVRDDRRFVIYPQHRFGSDIQKVAYSREFWDRYLGEYDEVTLDVFKDEAGLGRGHASMAEASYLTAEGTIARKRGIMFATLYNDRVYIVDCSAEESAYQKWRGDFLGIVKSIDFTKTIHELPTGNYRKFLNDAEVIIEGADELDVYRF